MDDCYEPVGDFTAPGQVQADRAVRFVRAAIEEGKPVAVSCAAGCGRTGTILACHSVCAGLTADEAIKRVVSGTPAPPSQHTSAPRSRLSASARLTAGTSFIIDRDLPARTYTVSSSKAG